MENYTIKTAQGDEYLLRFCLENSTCTHIYISNQGIYSIYSELLGKVIYFHLIFYSM